MLKRKPTFSIFKGAAGIFLAFEVVVGGALYYGWHKLNTSRDFRKTVGERYPTILDSYYKVGETVNAEYKGREVDQQIWETEKQRQQQVPK